MNDAAPRLLFVPVSGAFGRGEYARCLAIAEGARARWPSAAIHFVLSRQAPYAAQVPFPSTLLDASPTFHSAAVIALMREWRPDVVIFDNAGRTAQLRAAVRGGAKVVYISARRRQRSKAFRLAWMWVIEEHWIAYPALVAGDLGLVERLKLALLRRPRVRFLDVILAPAQPAAPSVQAVLGCAHEGYVLLVPGGGTGHPGAADAVARFLAAAGELAQAGHDSVLIGGPPDAGGSRLTVARAVPQADLAALMRGARLIVTNGGSTLLQAIASGRACVAVPIAGDQPQRIRRCVEAGVAVAAQLDAASIRAQALALLGDADRLQSLAGRAAALALADGVDIAVRALDAMLSA